MTDQENSYDYPEKEFGRKKKGLANAQKTGGAREIVRSLEWLSFPLVYWGGKLPEIPFRADCLYRPVQLLIGEKLSGLPTGIYAVHLVCGPDKPDSKKQAEDSKTIVNPDVVSIPLTETLIAKTSRSVQGARKYPRALPKIVPEADQWLARQEEALDRAAAALRAVLKIGKDVPQALAVEETCLWLGSEEDRPSRRIKPGSIQSWVSETPDTGETGKILAAMLLGREKRRIPVPGKFKDGLRLGYALDRWPIDLAVKLVMNRHRSSPVLNDLSGINHPQVAQTVWEWVIAGNPADVDFLNALSVLHHAISMLESEPVRRYQAMRNILSRSIQEIRGKTDESRLNRSLNDEEAESRIQLFANTFVPHLLDFIRKQGLPLRLNEWPSVKAMHFAYWYGIGSQIPTPVFKKGSWDVLFRDLETYIQMFGRPSPSGEAWQITLYGLAGRIAALTQNTESIMELSRWIESCRLYSFRYTSEEEPDFLVLSGLETGFVHSEGDRANMMRFLGILSELGRHILEKILGYHVDGPARFDFDLLGEVKKTLISQLQILSRYGTLTPEQSRFVVLHDSIGCTQKLLKKNRPDSLKDFVHWLCGQNEEWFHLRPHHQLTWAWLFQIDNRPLVKQLSRWATESVRSGLSWIQMSRIMDSILGFCVSESGLQEDPFEPDDFPDEAERQQFVRDCFWVIEDVIRSIEEWMCLAGCSEISGCDLFGEALSRRSAVLEIAYHWVSQSHRDERKLVGRLLELCLEQEKFFLKNKKPLEGVDFFPPDPGFQKLTVLLSGGEMSVLLEAVTRPARSDIHYEKLIRGWEFAEKFPEIRRFLLSRFRKRAHRPDVFLVLNLLETIRLLPEKDRLCDFLKDWEHPPGVDQHAFPWPVPEHVRILWRDYNHYRDSETGGLPDAVQKIMELPSGMQKEHQALMKKRKAGGLDRSAEKRLEQLTGILGNPEKMSGLISGKMLQLLARRVPGMKMEALKKGIKEAIQQHWNLIVEGRDFNAWDPDWDNALWLYLTIRKNKRLLKRLLNDEVKKEHSGYAGHPENRRFLKQLEQSGADSAAWLKGLEKTWDINGRMLTVYTENHPLKIFQMGNLFDTCLKVGGMYDYSVVANAYEVNKRVLYLKDETGRIIGRRLLLLNRDGTLFGCHSYGSCASYDAGAGGTPWVKILFDLFSMELAGMGGFRLPAGEEAVTAQDFRLFSDWYYDGIEDFDWWVTDRLFQSGGESASLPDSLYKDIHQHLLRDRYAEEDLLRLLIWLGDDLLPFIGEVARSPLIEKNELRYILRFTRGRQIKERIQEYLK
ncbi:hypothetical protein JW906_00710 [bacterium]|nr:hypothetical protein [bacterium]